MNKETFISFGNFSKEAIMQLNIESQHTQISKINPYICTQFYNCNWWMEISKESYK